jgi:hypothetical protein
MRLLLIAILTVGLGTEATFAQTNTLGSSPPDSPASLAKAGAPPPLPLLPTTASRTISPIPSAIIGPTPTGVSPPRKSLSLQSVQSAYHSAVADCMQMWDSGTHMTKQEWSRTCKRVQTRLDNLNVDVVMPKLNAQVR